MSDLKPYYQNDLVTLYKGDCLDIMQELQQTFDCCITDLPYGTTANKWDSIIPFEPMWENLKLIMKENAMLCFTASQPFSSLLVSSNIKMFKHEWIWIKNRGSNFANTVREPFKEHEHILCFSNGNWTYNKQMQERTGGGEERANYLVTYKSHSDNYRDFDDRNDCVLSNLRVPSSWQKFNTEVGLHPTQKPVSLIEYLIKTYTNENEIVLDFTSGSGTTDVAAMNLNRKCVLIEKEDKYCDIIVKRLKESQKEIDERLF